MNDVTPIPTSDGDPGTAQSPEAKLQSSEAADPEVTVRLTAPPVLRPLAPPPPGGIGSGGGGRRAWRVWVLGALVLLAGGSLAGYLLGSFGRHPAPSRPAAEAPPPPGLQIYLEQAKAGDPHAMRMLGLMYYYGLDVRQDQARGLAWYRRAAATGDPAARAELAKLEPVGGAK